MTDAIRTTASRKRTVTSRTRAAILWGLAVFALLQLSFHFPLSRWFPYLPDPEYGHKLASLREQIANKSPDKPLVVAFGSSLMSMALRPGVLATCQPANPHGTSVFNFGINGSRSVVSLLFLQRLLAEGIHPDWVLLEVYPRFFFGPNKNEYCFSAVRLQQGDLPAAQRYFDNAHRFRRKWRAGQCVPWFFYRNCLQNQFLYTWVPNDKKSIDWFNADQWGWACRPEVIQHLKTTYTAADFGENTKKALAGSNHDELTSAMDGALRDILTICQREQIGVVLVRMPESSYYRQAYSNAMNERIEKWFASLRLHPGVSMVNALDWIPDDEFADGIHVDVDGATRFTLSLEATMLRRLEVGQTRPSRPFDSVPKAPEWD